MLITDVYNNQVFFTMYDHFLYYTILLVYEAGRTLVDPGMVFFFGAHFNTYDISYRNNITEDPLQTYYTWLVK